METIFNYEEKQRLLNHLEDTANPHLYQDPLQTPGIVNTGGQMDEFVKTEVIETTGLTRTLPKARNELIGMDWTVILNVIGYVTISPDSGDAIILPTTDTTVTIYNKGTSLTFRCLDTTTWGIV